MERFVKLVVKPVIKERGYRNVCQIGASYGGDTDKLLAIDAIRLTVIDPGADEDLCAKYANVPNVKILKGLSLEYLPKLTETFDCILIDGDHNWYTVFHELKEIEDRRLLRGNGTIFLHDVEWPYGRRDLYYFPESIPEAFRHPYSKKGIVRGRSELANEGGVNASFFNATSEDGPRNGVLTAVEDFLKEHPGRFRFLRVRVGSGLGILMETSGGRTGPSYLKWSFVAKSLEAAYRVVRLFERLFPGRVKALKEDVL